MRRLIMVLILFAATPAFTGCRSQQLAKDQNQFRQVLLGMYEDQLMDNLIRAKNRMPLLHLDYTNITGTVTDTGTGNINGGPIGGTRTTTLGSTPSLVRAATSAFNYGISATQMNQLTVTANPIVDNPSVYLAYINFVKQPERLIESCNPPPPGAAHIVRQCGNRFYWVPVQFRNEFLEVALRTTGVRSEAISAPEFYTVAATSYSTVTPAPSSGRLKRYWINIQIDTAIPNDDGWLTAVVEGRLCRFRINKPDNGKLPGEDTKEFRLDYVYDPRRDPGPVSQTQPLLTTAPFSPDVIGKAIANKNVQIKLDGYKPPVPKLDNTLDSILSQTQLLRLNQLQLMGR